MPASRRQVLSNLCVGSLSALHVPFAKSDAAARVVDEVWTDTQRQRDLPVRIRLPIKSALGLIVHSHGLGGNREGGDAYGLAWAEAGFAVIHVQHPGSDSAVWRTPNPAQSLRAAANGQQLIARVADVQFVLSEAVHRKQTQQPQWSQVGMDAVGVSGHSFGARTAQALAGERFGVPGEDRLVDQRINAFIAFSPSAGAPRPVNFTPFANIRRPFLCVTGSLDGDPFGRFNTGDERQRVYAELPSGNKAQLVLDGADHATFSGNSVPIRPNSVIQRQAQAVALERRHLAVLVALSTHWWRASLLGDAAARAALAAPVGLLSGDRWMTG
jgi:predicted dienelactone hydrolase